MLPRVLAIDDETVRILDHFFIAVARNVPHDNLVTLADTLPPNYSVLNSGPAHVRKRRLVTDNLGNRTGNEGGIIPKPLQLIWILVHEPKPPGDRVARGIVTADNQKDKIAEEFTRLHVSRCRRMGQHRDQIGARRLVDALVPKSGE